MLYLESYGSGSHQRIARLFQRFSTHHIDVIFLARDHWRWLAIAGHRNFAAAISNLDYPRPDVVVCSGPAPANQTLAHLPRAWGQIPCAAYFHESQWTYPATDFDPRPYLMGHLETLEAADEIWFNSRFHQDTFLDSAFAAHSTQLRKLARTIMDENWRKTRVMHPPVHVDAQPGHRNRDGVTIAWAARWEPEKRPDIFVRTLTNCIDQGMEPTILLLGSPSAEHTKFDALPARLRRCVSPLSGFPDRSEYESLLARTDVWISTAEHDFFGVAALESALLGATPLLPRALAYTETLPSAPSYTPGDDLDLARALTAVARHSFGAISPWSIDAMRFRSPISVARFDERIAVLARAR